MWFVLSKESGQDVEYRCWSVLDRYGSQYMMQTKSLTALLLSCPQTQFLDALKTILARIGRRWLMRETLGRGFPIRFGMPGQYLLYLRWDLDTACSFCQTSTSHCCLLPVPASQSLASHASPTLCPTICLRFLPLGAEGCSSRCEDFPNVQLSHEHCSITNDLFAN